MTMHPWTGTSVRLRALEPSDWPVLRRIAEDAEYVEQGGVVPPRPATVFQRRTSPEFTAREDDEFTLAIVGAHGEEILGTVSTRLAQPWNGTFGASIALDAERRGRGHATEAAVLLLRYMFSERRYQKCNVEVLPFNRSSLRLCERLGFVEEGRRRRSHFGRGRQHDVVLLGITAEEYLEQWEAAE
ncbi:GNAT family N-acetyltransferase [Micromonospora arborensis]|uniref:GNAT family N-acetyltransferase n=1 Tax=Micromonospora arborensis TaxID=2116518 RepID=UPI0037221A85